MKNWQKTLAVWAETTELVAAFERERRRECDSPANLESPKLHPSCGTFQDGGLTESG